MEALLLKDTQACELLGVSRTVLYELSAAGRLPSVKIGASRRWTREGLEAFVAGLVAEQSPGAA